MLNDGSYFELFEDNNYLNEKEINEDKCPYRVDEKLPYLPNYYYKNYNNEYILPNRYRPIRCDNNEIRVLGRGSFGVVIVAEDLHSKGKLVAIKKISDAFEISNSHRILREIQTLKTLQYHPNIVELIDIFIPGETLQEMKDVYIVTSIMKGGNLTTLFKEIFNNKKERITIELIKDIMSQLLSALSYIHSANITHRDLKPDNILFERNFNNEIKIRVCDFGSVNEPSSPEGADYSSVYALTKRYRPPEVILRYPVESSAIDSWACGCILAELLYLLQPKLRPLFVLNKTWNQMEEIKEHLDLIIRLLGAPKDLNDVKSSTELMKIFIDIYLSNSNTHFSNDSNCSLFPMIFPEAPKEAIDLLQCFLQWSPEKRITTSQAMNHPFLKGNKHLIFAELIDRDTFHKVQQFLEINFLNFLFYKEVIGYNYYCNNNNYNKLIESNNCFNSIVQLRYEVKELGVNCWDDLEQGGYRDLTDITFNFEDLLLDSYFKSVSHVEPSDCSSSETWLKKRKLK
ncbi:hypothetical protein ABK040_000798 [Willaertia magna]